MCLPCRRANPLHHGRQIAKHLVGTDPERAHAHRGELELIPYVEEKHTIEGLRFAYGTLNMEVGPAVKGGGRRSIELMCDVPFKLKVRQGEKTWLHDLHPGMHTLQA